MKTEMEHKEKVSVEEAKDAGNTVKTEKQKKIVSKKETMTKKNVEKKKITPKETVGKKDSKEVTDAMQEVVKEKMIEEQVTVAETLTIPTPKKRGRKKKSETIPKSIDVNADKSIARENKEKAGEEKAGEEKVSKKRATKKQETKSNDVLSTKVVFQYQGSEVELQYLIEKAKQAFLAESGEDALIHSMDIYVKPEDNAAYYVVNGNAAGKVAME